MILLKLRSNLFLLLPKTKDGDFESTIHNVLTQDIFHPEFKAEDVIVFVLLTNVLDFSRKQGKPVDKIAHSQCHMFVNRCRHQFEERTLNGKLWFCFGFVQKNIFLLFDLEIRYNRYRRSNLNAAQHRPYCLLAK